MIRVTVWYEYTQVSGVLKREFLCSDISEADFEKLVSLQKLMLKRLKKFIQRG